ncbi:MAG: hypothetical protein DLM50_06195 [Candidatus Meridianibacter frigidus]|nr:MAG: hypothetical protein DLM50_06195 [Candidatus Eremiobacteraeota bacterium]
MRRYLTALLLASTVTLLGLGHRPAPRVTPSPTPVPTATPTPAPVLPTAIIYPFSVSGDTDKTAGAKLAALFAQEIHQSGGVILEPLPIKPIGRADYLNNAIKTGADYYISGYITPLGDEVSLVEQLVSTSSGAIIWANTTQVLTYGDAISQADSLRSAILAHAGRVEAQYKQQQAAPTPPPGPANGTQTSIGQLLGLLHRKTPTAKASIAANLKPAAPVLVPQVADESVATASLARSLDRAYNVTRSAVATSNPAADAHTICGALTSSSIAAGSARSAQHGFPRTITYTFSLRVYRCDGTMFFTHSSKGGTLDEAVDAAVDAFMSAHPKNV